MVDYDLTEFGRRPYGRASQAMRFGMAAFALGLGGWFGWQSYLNIISKGLRAGYVVGIVGIYFILGMFLYMAAIQRSHSTRTTGPRFERPRLLGPTRLLHLREPRRVHGVGYSGIGLS
jgi:hypothetical protein